MGKQEDADLKVGAARRDLRCRTPKARGPHSHELRITNFFATFRRKRLWRLEGLQGPVKGGRRGRQSVSVTAFRNRSSPLLSITFPLSAIISCVINNIPASFQLFPQRSFVFNNIPASFQQKKNSLSCFQSTLRWTADPPRRGSLQWKPAKRLLLPIRMDLLSPGWGRVQKRPAFPGISAAEAYAMIIAYSKEFVKP